MRSSIDEINNTYGLWTVIARAPRKGTRTYWTCRCGCSQQTERDIWAADLRRGESVSCGCLPKGRKLFSNRELVAFNMRISQYRKNASKQGRMWSLLNHDCWALFKAPYFYCLAVETNIYTSRKVRSVYAVIKYNGIDRIDNDLGYEKSNVVSCCIICNRAKRDLPFEKFLI